MFLPGKRLLPSYCTLLSFLKLWLKKHDIKVGDWEADGKWVLNTGDTRY